MIFTDEADAGLLLSSLQPAANTQQLLEMLKASQKSRVKGECGRQSDNRFTQNSHGPAVFSNIDFRGKAVADHRRGCSTQAECVFGVAQ